MQKQDYSALIKNQDLIIEQLESDDKTKFVLQQDVKLSEVFHFLPAGKINKVETGIGATHLELYSHRHSIVVEPLRVTAQSKMDKNIFYFSADDKLRERTLKEYVDNKEIEYKKILVVIDSLPTLIDVLSKHGFALHDFFLLIDEIDSVQRDSTFRLNMEKAIDIYEKFPEDKRALISATLKDFSKPELQNQPLTEYRYENQIKQDVSIIYSNSSINHLRKTLEELLKSNEDKIFVASNEIRGCYDLAFVLIEAGLVQKSDITFLLGSDKGNKKICKKFSNRNIEDSKLPTRLNFASSAFFSGFDINEDYALVVVASHYQDSSRYSLEEIIQIKGRCRKKLTSMHILASVYLENLDDETIENLKPVKLYTVDELNHLANKQLNMLRCQDEYTVEGDELDEFISKWRNEISSKIERVNESLVRKNRQGKYEISYLSIDAWHQNSVVIKDMYWTKDLFRKKIETCFNVISEYTANSNYETVSTREKSKRIIEELFELLGKCKSRRAFHDSVSVNISKSKEYTLIKDIMNLGEKLQYTNVSVNVELMKQNTNEKLMNLKQYLMYTSMPKAKSTIKHFVENEFVYGKEYTKDDYYKKVSTIAIDLGAYTKTEIAVKSQLKTLPMEVKKKLDKFAKTLFNVSTRKRNTIVVITEKNYVFVSSKKKQH